MTKLFQSNHDAVVLGVLTAAGDPPRKLASLADLVRHMICCEGLADLPFPSAAARVLDKLAIANPLPGLYLTDPAAFACAITPETLLRAGRVGRDAGTTRQINTGWSATSWGADKSQYRDVKFPKLSAIAERRGVPGLLDELREAWCIKARCVTDLDNGRPARVAMAYDVAKEMFGLVDASFGDQSTQAALPLAIVGAAATSGHGQAAPLLKLPAIGDGPGRRQLYDEWVALGGESSGATKILAARFGVTTRTIQTRIYLQRDVNEPQTMAARASKGSKPKSAGAGSKLSAVWVVKSSKAKR